ncbi:hypothetical protein ACFO4N_09665 [Camelliibacillus cellulosilyticus]|uniref:Uncharacterized protein n=1 Tax=Camelliibacillus cellulosilyticus TaxID=2174486 RepID=A0ABV9GQR5_9BACL
MTGPLITSIVFWLIGILVIIGGRVLYDKIRKAQENLRERAKEEKFNDNSASFAYAIGSEALDTLPWFYVRLVFIIAGMIFIAIGFVALGFIAV